MNSNEIMGLGVEEKHKGNYNEAIRLYNEAEKIDSGNPDIYMSMGKTLYILGKLDQAAKCYIQCAELIGRDNPNIWLHLGHAVIDNYITGSIHAALAEQYRVFLDPYFEENGTRRHNIKLSFDIQEDYNGRCRNVGENIIGNMFVNLECLPPLNKDFENFKSSANNKLTNDPSLNEAPSMNQVKQDIKALKELKGESVLKIAQEHINDNNKINKKYTKACENADVIIFEKFITNNGKVILEGIIRKREINLGSHLLIGDNIQCYATSVINLDFQVSKIKINSDNSICIINRGQPKCRELLDSASRGDQVCIMVAGNERNFNFITDNELIAAKVITIDEYNKYILR